MPTAPKTAKAAATKTAPRPSTLLRGQEIFFKRFNDETAKGVATGRKLIGRRGPWFNLSVDWQDKPLKIRLGQVLKIDGVRVQ